MSVKQYTKNQLKIDQTKRVLTELGHKFEIKTPFSSPKVIVVDGVVGVFNSTEYSVSLPSDAILTKKVNEEIASIIATEFIFREPEIFMYRVNLTTFHSERGHWVE